MPQDTELLIQIHSDLKLLTQKVESAFPRDANDEVDYTGHKMYHQELITAEEDARLSKKHLTNHVASWVVVGLLTVLSTTIWEMWVGPFIKNLVK